MRSVLSLSRFALATLLLVGCAPADARDESDPALAESPLTATSTLTQHTAFETAGAAAARTAFLGSPDVTAKRASLIAADPGSKALPVAVTLTHADCINKSQCELSFTLTQAVYGSEGCDRCIRMPMERLETVAADVTLTVTGGPSPALAPDSLSVTLR